MLSVCIFNVIRRSAAQSIVGFFGDTRTAGASGLMCGQEVSYPRYTQVQPTGLNTSVLHGSWVSRTRVVLGLGVGSVIAISPHVDREYRPRSLSHVCPTSVHHRRVVERERANVRLEPHHGRSQARADNGGGEGGASLLVDGGDGEEGRPEGGPRGCVRGGGEIV